MEYPVRLFFEERKSIFFNGVYPASYNMMAPPCGWERFECLPPMSFVVEDDGSTHYNRKAVFGDTFFDEFDTAYTVSKVVNGWVYTTSGHSISLLWCADHHFV